MAKWLDRLHGEFVHSRRVASLLRLLVPLLPTTGKILDIGCGDGLLTERIAKALPDAEVFGIDTLVRSQTHVRVEAFDGNTIPADDNSVDTALLVDVLHHTDDPRILLAEAKRVVRKSIVIKDHLREGPFAAATLRWMDRVGNAKHGVALPFNYLSRSRWHALLDDLDLHVETWNDHPRIYGFPGDLIFGRRLQVVMRLNRRGSLGRS